MGRKTPENRYGIKVGDIFCQHDVFEDSSGWGYAQVVALKGEVTVVLKPIKCRIVAFDEWRDFSTPAPDQWIEGAEIIEKRVNQWKDKEIYIKDRQGDYWYPYKEGKRHMGSTSPAMARCFEFFYLEEESGFNIQEGSGIFALEKSVGGPYSDIPVVIRYPDGREEKILSRDLYLSGKRTIDKEAHKISYTSDCRHSQYWPRDYEEIFSKEIRGQEAGTWMTVSCTMEQENLAVCFGTGEGEEWEEERFEGSGFHTKTVLLREGKAYVRLTCRRGESAKGHIQAEIQVPGLELSQLFLESG